MRSVRLGTRRSRLAVMQAETVARLLQGRHPDVDVEIVKVVAEGDEDQPTRPGSWGKGAFVRTLQQKCLDGEIDAAVHSLKDLPLEGPDGLVLASVPLRDDPRDALVSRDRRSLHELRSGAKVGTSSERRAVQLRELRPDVEIVELRGNVDTRVRKVLEHSACDAAVISYAALKRLGLDHLASEVFDVDRLVPAPGQGAIAVECLAENAELVELFGTIEDRKARLEVEVERRVARLLGGGCRVPVGVNAMVADGRIRIVAVSTGDRGLRRSNVEGPLDSVDRLIDRIVKEMSGGG
ncbi:MAG: hydroxymethylbilane synthase [Nitrososphaerota archaeon]|nr:hydroxymethylbilane synthase [Candidatus Calditenuis fumarioli]